MATQVSTRRARCRWTLLLVPWLLLAAVVAGCVAREMVWRGTMARLADIERLVTGVCRAPSPEAERDALQHLAQWTASTDIGVSISAYSRSDGRSIPIAGISSGGGPEAAFEVGFDVDGDRTPERTYHLCLRVMEHINLLMIE